MPHLFPPDSKASYSAVHLSRCLSPTSTRGNKPTSQRSGMKWAQHNNSPGAQLAPRVGRETHMEKCRNVRVNSIAFRWPSCCRCLTCRVDDSLLERATQGGESLVLVAAKKVRGSCQSGSGYEAPLLSPPSSASPVLLGRERERERDRLSSSRGALKKKRNRASSLARSALSLFLSTGPNIRG